jgi:hypothetical protein
MEREMNEKESLQLITEMITQARSAFQKGRGDGIVLWGYTIATIAIINYVLLLVFDSGYWVWYLTLPVFLIHFTIECKRGRKALVKNKINEMIGHVWLGFAISCATFLASVFIIGIGFQKGTVFLLINPVIIGMSGLSLFATGKIFRFKPFEYGAYIFWAGAIISAVIPVIWLVQSPQFIVLALCMLTGFVIPGHILNHKADQDV